MTALPQIAKGLAPQVASLTHHLTSWKLFCVRRCAAFSNAPTKRLLGHGSRGKARNPNLLDKGVQSYLCTPIGLRRNCRNGDCDQRSWPRRILRKMRERLALTKSSMRWKSATNFISCRRDIPQNFKVSMRERKLLRAIRYCSRFRICSHAKSKKRPKALLSFKPIASVARMPRMLRLSALTANRARPIVREGHPQAGAWPCPRHARLHAQPMPLQSKARAQNVPGPRHCMLSTLARASGQHSHVRPRNSTAEPST